MKQTKKTSATKRTKIDEYDPVIYPRKLWVSLYNGTMKPFIDKFCYRDGCELIDMGDSGETDARTYCVVEKSTGKYGYLVLIDSIGLKDKTLLIDIIAHESEHVKTNIFEDIHLYTNVESQEADAYMVGFIAKSIWKTIFSK